MPRTPRNIHHVAASSAGKRMSQLSTAERQQLHGIVEEAVIAMDMPAACADTKLETSSRAELESFVQDFLTAYSPAARTALREARPPSMYR